MNKNDFYYVLSTKLDTQIVVFWWGYVGKNILLGGKLRKNEVIILFYKK